MVAVLEKWMASLSLRLLPCGEVVVAFTGYSEIYPFIGHGGDEFLLGKTALVVLL